MAERSQEFSFGVVPMSFESDVFVFLVIRHRKGHWGFPKGKPDPGESEIETARREFTEETGIRQFSLMEYVSFTEQYGFDRTGKNIRKAVKYFLGIVKDRELHLQEDEVQDARWLSFDEALATLTFPEARTLLQSVKRCVDQDPSRFKKAFS